MYTILFVVLLLYYYSICEFYISSIPGKKQLLYGSRVDLDQLLKGSFRLYYIFICVVLFVLHVRFDLCYKITFLLSETIL